jgi:hypothetical protein
MKIMTLAFICVFAFTACAGEETSNTAQSTEFSDAQDETPLQEDGFVQGPQDVSEGDSQLAQGMDSSMDIAETGEEVASHDAFAQPWTDATPEDVGGEEIVDASQDDPPVETHGTVPPEALAAPAFAALNYDGGTRATEDLLGHPTVMWFFPFAGTPG